MHTQRALKSVSFERISAQYALNMYEIVGSECDMP